MKLERQSAAKKRREEDEAQEAKSNSVADTGHAIGAALNAELLMHATNLRLDYHCPQVAASASKDMVNMTIQMCGEAMKQAWRVNPQMSEAGIGNVMQQLNDSLRSIDTPEKERAELHKGLGSAFISPVHRSLGVSAAYPEGKSRCVDMPLIPMLERLFRWCASLTRTLTLTLTLTLALPLTHVPPSGVFRLRPLLWWRAPRGRFQRRGRGARWDSWDRALGWRRPQRIRGPAAQAPARAPAARARRRAGEPGALDEPAQTQEAEPILARSRAHSTKPSLY